MPGKNLGIIIKKCVLSLISENSNDHWLFKEKCNHHSGFCCLEYLAL